MDWDDRFRKEYQDLSTRAEKLRLVIVAYKAGTLDFQPRASLNLLTTQYNLMKAYLKTLEIRAEVEGVTLR